MTSFWAWFMICRIRVSMLTISWNIVLVTEIKLKESWKVCTYWTTLRRKFVASLCLLTLQY